MDLNLLNGDFQLLYQFLSSSMDAFDYNKSIQYASYCELAIYEDNLSPENDIVLKFYAFQMVIYINMNIIIILFLLLLLLIIY